MASFPPQKNEILASNLLFGGLVLTVALALIRHHVLPAGNQVSDARFAGGLALVALLYGGLFYAIRRGHPWARVLLLLLVVLAALGSAINYRTTFAPQHLDPLNVISTFVHYGVRLWALWLLFRTPRLQIR